MNSRIPDVYNTAVILTPEQAARVEAHLNALLDHAPRCPDCGKPQLSAITDTDEPTAGEP